MRNNESLTQKTIILTAARTIGLLVNILLPIILVRLISVEEYGVYKIVGTVAIFTASTLPLGMIQSLYYFLPTYKERHREILSNTIIFLVGCAIFLLLVFFTLYKIDLLWFAKGLSSFLIFIIFVIFILTFFNSVIAPFLIADNRTVSGAKFLALSDVIIAVVILIFSFLGRSSSWVMFGWMTGGVIFFIISLWAIRQYFPLIYEKDLMRMQLRYALPFGFANIVNMVQFYLHQFTVSIFFNAAMFAIYSVGTFQLPVVRIWYSSVADVILIRMTELRAQGLVSEVLNLWLSSIRKLALVFIPAMVFMFIVAKVFIVVFFTDQYANSVPIFMVSLAQYLTYIVNCHSVLRAFGETSFIFKNNTIMLMITIVLLIPLVKVIGVMGAVLATVLAAYISNGLMLIKISSLLSVSMVRLFPWGNLAKIFLLSIGSGVLAFLVTCLSFSGIIKLVAAAIVFSLAYFIGVWILPGILAEEERAALRQIKKHILWN